MSVLLCTPPNTVEICREVLCKVNTRRVAVPIAIVDVYALLKMSMKTGSETSLGRSVTSFSVELVL